MVTIQLAILKKKIIKYLRFEKSTKQLYLFSIKHKTINPTLLFNQLSQDNNIDITHLKLCQYLTNIVEESQRFKKQRDCDDIFSETKDLYDFDDFLSFKHFEWDEKKFITEPIGQKLVIKRVYPFVSNPYNVTSHDPLIQRDIDNILTTQNSNVLFEYGELVGNNIFMCFAEEVLQYAQKTEAISEKYMISLFFPHLFITDHITSLSQLRQRAHDLYENQRPIIGETFEQYNENIDMFYDMFFTKKTELDYLENTPGISEINFTIHPLYNIHLPLEILFKLIHSTQEIPLIKYNPGNNRENIYRLYTDNIATNGKKIPYLYTINGNRKGLIMKLSKIIATRKRVAFYISLSKEDGNYNLICAFEANGNINISLTLEKPLSLGQIEEIVKEAINVPILNKISEYLEQSGYNYLTFNSFKDRNIEIRKLDYTFSLIIKKNVHLKTFIKCLSSVFNVVEGDLTKSSERVFLQYKRVSNYNAMDSKEAFINELRKQGKSIPEIIKELISNFQMSEGDAKLKVASWVSNVKTEAGVFENKGMTIRTNTGFPVIMRRNKQTFQTLISVDSINNVHYLHFIQIYMDSLLRLIIAKKSSALSIKAINSRCKGSKAIQVDDEEDIQAKVEQELLTQQSPTINNNQITFGEEDDGKQQALLDLLLGDDDEEETSDEEDDTTDEEDEEKDDSLNIEFGEEIGDDFSLSKSQTPPSIGNLSLSPSPQSIPSIGDLSPSPSDSSSEAEVDLTGMALKGAQNIFLSKKLDLQPKLFLKRPQGRFKAYSRACPSATARQPVLLTAKEKQYIDTQDTATGTKSYDEYITYGTGDTKYHYICPRFWCLSDDQGKQRSLSLKEINEGQCGGWDALIPPDSSKVPEGKRIYEFTDPRLHKESVKGSNMLVYKPMYPGFFNPSKHPDNLCIPCCFGKPTTNQDSKKPIPYMYKPVGKDNPEGIGPTYKRDADGTIDLRTIHGEPQIREGPAKSRITIYDECNEAPVEPGTIKHTLTKKLETAPLLEKFPLNARQLGYLPINVQKFMGYNCKKICQQSINDKQLKLNQPCLLHKGMEKSETQSFLACISDAYHYFNNEKIYTRPIKLSKDPESSIETIKTIIIEILTIDSFITLQNGALIKLFSDDLRQIEPDAYNNSHLYQIAKKEMDEAHFQEYIHSIASAYENFIDYLKNPNVIIDYEYLWDFITMDAKSGGLFTNGINLIILKSPDDDITNKIELVCPSNHYSSDSYNTNKKILILYNKGTYFEPIYKYIRKTKDKYLIRKFFYLPDMNQIMPEIERIMGLIWRNLVTKCNPLPSMPEKYNNTLDFKENVIAPVIIAELQKGLLGYQLESQIINFETKVIGVLATKEGEAIYIPSLPSAINNALPYTYVHNPHMWTTYQKTHDQLQYIYDATKKRIPCKPTIKVVDNNVIIGILTETNQMVPIIPQPYQSPAESGIEDDGLKIIHHNSEGEDKNYLQIDADTLLNKDIDEERIIKVKQIQLESNFYNIFRNLLRIVLTNFENKREKINLLEIIKSPTIPYINKLREINTILRRLLSNRIDFIIFDLVSLRDIESVVQCLGLKKSRCDEEEVCSFSVTGDGCILQLPEKNLINGSDNEETYYGRLSDELIRYTRIQTYIFKPKTFLSFQEIPYRLREDEIILLEELLYGDYFVDLIPVHHNPFIRSKAIYDLVEPNTSVPYKTRYNLDVLLQSNPIGSCVLEESGKHTLFLGHWKDGKLIRTREKKVDADGKEKIVIKARREPPILEGYELQEFKHTFECSWRMMMTIINDFTGQTLNIGNIRTSLIEKYVIFFREGRREQILSILKKEGKRDQVTALKAGTAIGDIITMANYYLSLLDIFILSKAYQLPCLLLCRTNIPTFQSDVASFIESESSFSYLLFSGSYHKVDSNVSPTYGIISKDGAIRIPNAFLSSYEQFTANNITTLDDFMEEIRKGKLQHKSRIRKLKKKKRKLVIQPRNND